LRAADEPCGLSPRARLRAAEQPATGPNASGSESPRRWRSGATPGHGALGPELRAGGLSEPLARSSGPRPRGIRTRTRAPVALRTRALAGLQEFAMPHLLGPTRLRGSRVCRILQPLASPCPAPHAPRAPPYRAAGHVGHGMGVAPQCPT